MMFNVLLVGSNPSNASPDISDFHPSTRSRIILDQWFNGMAVNNISYTNVAAVRTPENRPLRISEIRRNLPRLQNITKNYSKIIALGKTASKALSMLDIEHFAAPHPSGLNRQLNNKDYVAEMIQQLTLYIES